ncbi:protein arginine N-methyltransferase [Scenedesmus sp. NREL 46B-D3]|nr:protein arginine N-methyltransferase [Scenedesmus sp. NREL 46B-D3]
MVTNSHCFCHCGVCRSRLDGKAPEGSDFANYFCTYAYLYHQKDMLEDHKRTGAYYNAVIQNRRQFKDKVVLDVGTGSGILAIFSAMAGARKVYAVEATDMAKHARTLVAHNKFDGVIEVVQGTIETIELPEKVDIIISEWMGYFLLRESMLDSVLLARDRFLKPGGALYPSHARMFLAPMRTNASAGRINDFQNSMYGWSEFIKEMKGFYQVDLDCLSEAYRSEQKEYYMSTSAWGNVHPSQLMGPGACFKKYDLHTVTIDELKADLVAEVSLPIVDACGPVDAFCGWFDVEFKGSEQNPADDPVKLPTAPDATGPTHWGQQVFMLHPSIDVASGDSLATKVKVARQKVNHRLLELDLEVKVTGNSIHATGEPRQLNWHID